MTVWKPFAAALVLALAGASLAGCGRMSALDTPTQAEARAAAKDRSLTREQREAAAAEARKPQPDKPFILDGLIE